MLSMRALIVGLVTAFGLGFVGRRAELHAHDIEHIGDKGRISDGLAAVGRPRRRGTDADQLSSAARPLRSGRSA